MVKKFLCALSLFVLMRCASPSAETVVPSPLTPQCLLAATQMQGIPWAIIMGLLKTEGGSIGSESRNTNGSVDLGPMQVNNTTWVPVLAKAHFHGDTNTAYNMLKYNGCYNVFIGTWIYRQYVDEAHGDYAEAVGYYNSHNEGPKKRYQRKFAENFMSLFGNLAR